MLAAAWIAKASGEQADVDKAEDMWDEVTILPCIITHSKILSKYYLLSNASLSAQVGGSGTNPSEVSWDDKWALTYLIMYDITGKVARQIPR